MRTGRKPKPFFLKLAEGNRGRRKLKPGADLPPGPFESPFPLDGIARKEWDRIIAAAYWLRETICVMPFEKTGMKGLRKPKRKI